MIIILWFSQESETERDNAEKMDEESENQDSTMADGDLATSGEKDDNDNVEMKEDSENEISKEICEPDLFSLSVVNAYGSQEVRKLEDGKTYTLTSK